MPTGIRENNPNWSGGRYITSHGYIKIRLRAGHHLVDATGYAYEHRVVAETKLGRRLLPGEMIHHIDGNKQKNVPENIQVVTGNAEHYYEHRPTDSELRKPHEANIRVECACGCGETEGGHRRTK